MGLRIEYIDFINQSIQVAELGEPRTLKMCELGNQHVRISARRLTEAKTGKEYFTNLGYDHTSIDWNGEDGALPLDLRIPISDQRLLGSFDILTNSGTTEHVEDQYECFRNLHYLVKAGGLFIHLSPQTGSWAGHGLFYYTFAFYQRLAAMCHYAILREQQIAAKGEGSNLVCVAMKKLNDNAFIARADFDEIARGAVFSA